MLRSAPPPPVALTPCELIAGDAPVTDGPAEDAKSPPPPAAPTAPAPTPALTPPEVIAVGPPINPAAGSDDDASTPPAPAPAPAPPAPAPPAPPAAPPNAPAAPAVPAVAAPIAVVVQDVFPEAILLVQIARRVDDHATGDRDAVTYSGD